MTSAPSGKTPQLPGSRKMSGRRLALALAVPCAAALAAGALLREPAPVFGLHAVIGFAGCVVLVLAARALQVLVKRSESYHDGDR